MIKRLIVLSVLAFVAFGCQGSDAPTDVEEIQKEAASQVPKDLGTVPPEKAQEGLKQMGGAKKGG